MLKFIEDWLTQTLDAPDCIILYRLRKTAGDVNSIHVQFVSPDGEGELFAWEDGRMDALLFKSDGEENVSARFVLNENYQDFVASLLATLVDQLMQPQSGIKL